MENHFTSVKKQSISKVVAEQIKELIAGGNLKPGDKLPNERELAKIFGVGRLSLREGLRILEATGIVRTQYGVDSGTYVKEISTGELSEKLSEMLLFSSLTIEQLTEARLEISMITLKYFIRNAGQIELEALEACLKEGQEAFKAGRRTREKNLYFHELIAEGSKNPIFIMLHRSLIKILRYFLSKFESPPDHSRRVLENHKKTLRYLKEKNLEMACQSMKDHIIYVGNRTKSLLEGDASSESNIPDMH